MLQTKNEIFAALSSAIADRSDYRCVCNFTNGDTMLVDFSACGEEFTGDLVCSWSLQRDTHDENGNYTGTDEIDNGVFTQYEDVYDFVVRTLSQNEGTIYVECY